MQHRAATSYPGRVSTSPMATGQVRKGTNWLLVVGIVALLFVLGGGMLTALIIRSVNQSVQWSVETETDGEMGNLPEGVTFVPKGTTDPEKLPASLKPWYYPDSTIEHSMTASIGSFGGGAVLTMVTERATQRLSGASVVREDVRQAVIRAVLAAVNRRVEPLIPGAGDAQA